jgi:integrase
MTAPATPSKPPKPYPAFPLTASNTGQWSKTIRKKRFYFGPWVDWKGALERYNAQREHLYAGTTPPEIGVTVAGMLNTYGRTKIQQVVDGQFSARSLAEYKLVWDVIVGCCGKSREIESLTREDFAELRSRLGKGKNGKPIAANSHKKLLAIARMPFNFACSELDCTVRHYKTALRSPTALEIRRAKNRVGERLMTAEEIRTLVAGTSDQLSAMILLGINAGFGPGDCASLTVEAVDLAKGEHRFARPKTEVQRRCILWPETCSALAKIIGDRTSGPMFLTAVGNTWHGKGKASPISHEFRKACRRLGIYRNNATLFYSLRRTLGTIGVMANQPVALSHILGHAPSGNDMASVYRQKVFRQQLQIVADFMREWYLLGSPQ